MPYQSSSSHLDNDNVDQVEHADFEVKETRQTVVYLPYHQSSSSHLDNVDQVIHAGFEVKEITRTRTRRS